jgi:hypothetical protein
VNKRVFNNVFTLGSNASANGSCSGMSALSAELSLDGGVEIASMSGAGAVVLVATAVVAIYAIWSAAGGVSILQFHGVNNGEFSDRMRYATESSAERWTNSLQGRRGNSSISDFIRTIPIAIPITLAPLLPPREPRTHIIYVLHDDDMVVQYVGRTTLTGRAFRETAHKANHSRAHLTFLRLGSQLHVICTCLIKLNCPCIRSIRMREQAGIEFFNTLNPVPVWMVWAAIANGKPEDEAWRMRQNNQRNEIRPRSRLYRDEYLPRRDMFWGWYVEAHDFHTLYVRP